MGAHEAELANQAIPHPYPRQRLAAVFCGGTALRGLCPSWYGPSQGGATLPLPLHPPSAAAHISCLPCSGMGAYTFAYISVS